MGAQNSTGSARFCISKRMCSKGHPARDEAPNNFRTWALPTASIFHHREGVIRWSTKVTDLLPTHPRLFRFIVHHDVRLSRHPLDVHGPDSVPNVTLIGKPLPVLLGAVRDGDRHDDAPDEGSASQNSQVGVIKLRGIVQTRVRMPCTKPPLMLQM